MPTENRSSNTEMESCLSPCPFCGSVAQAGNEGKGGSWIAKIQCTNPFCSVRLYSSQAGRDLMRQTAVTKWNARAQPAPQPHADPGEVERLRQATAFVQSLVDCAGTQQSVATGYVRDILDLLKGNATPSAPVELQRMTFEYAHADGERHTVALSREEVAGYMDEFLFEKLTEEICHCEPIGETNVVDCRCDEVAEQFILVKPS